MTPPFLAVDMVCRRSAFLLCLHSVLQECILLLDSVYMCGCTPLVSFPSAQVHAIPWGNASVTTLTLAKTALSFATPVPLALGMVGVFIFAV